MKAFIFTLIFYFSTTFCHEYDPPSHIQQILQIAGISDESSNLPCDPFLGVVMASTCACSYCGIPFPIGCAFSTCTASSCIICCAPIINSDTIKEYVTDTNFCGARICRLILNVFMAPKPTYNSHSLFSKSNTEKNSSKDE